MKTNKTKNQPQRNSYSAGIPVLIIAGFFGFLLGNIRKKTNDYKAFAEAFILAQESERQRLALDLHDDLEPSILLIQKQIKSIREATLKNQKMITEALDKVRSISKEVSL